MKLIGFLAALIIGGFIGYTIAPRVPVVSPSGDTFQMEVAEINDSSAAYAVNARYPQFGISSIDAQIQAAVDGAIAELKSLPPNPSDSATPQNSFDGTFGSIYAGPDVVSLELILSQYTGGAHPMTLVSGVNYDRTSGRQLMLEDALAMIGLTVEEVSAKATAELQAKLGESFFREGATTNPENFSSFLISKDTLTFIFQQYQVAPYAAGTQEVSFERIK